MMRHISFVTLSLSVFWAFGAARADAPALYVPQPVPAPALPTPNAFDEYLAPGLNVRHLALIVRGLPFPNASDPLTEDEKTLLRQNAWSLKKLRQGFSFPYWNPPVHSMATLLSYYRADSILAQLLLYETQNQAAHHQWRAAAQTCLEVIRFGEDIPHGSPIYGAQTGLWIQSQGRAMLWDILEHLDAPEAMQAAQKLSDLQENEFTPAHMLLEEKWSGQGQINEVFTDPDVVYAPGVVAYRRSNMSVMREHVLYLTYSDYMDAWVTFAAQPYLPNAQEPPVPPLDGDAQRFFPFNDRPERMRPVLFQARVNETENALLTVALALRSYRLAHGRDARSLYDLTPELLVSMPHDPFSAGNLLRYRQREGRPVLYSVGPDGTDDGSTAIDSRLLTPDCPDARYDVKPESHGDIVAGINVY